MKLVEKSKGNMLIHVDVETAVEVLCFSLDQMNVHDIRLSHSLPVITCSIPIHD